MPSEPPEEPNEPAIGGLAERISEILAAAEAGRTSLDLDAVWARVEEHLGPQIPAVTKDQDSGPTNAGGR